MYAHLLLPLDGSDLAERALPHAVAVAKSFGARVTVLRVIAPIVSTAEAEFAVATSEEVMEAEIAVGEAYVKHIVETLQSEGLQADGETHVGLPPSTIV